MFLKIIILFLLFLVGENYSKNQDRITALFIPPESKSKIYYRHSFPFKQKLGESFEHSVERVFYELLLKRIVNSTKIYSITKRKPDAYPFYAQVKPSSADDFAKFIEVPATTFSFTFDNFKPDIVIQIDSLAIYSSSANSSGVAVVSGLAETLIDNTIANGDFNIDFKFYIWDNKNYKLINAGYCEADEYSDNPTVSEWNDIINEVLDKVFEDTKLE